ncbi:MAG: MFS transporter [Chthoniobacterales bacterium]|nr:MFS transporter [Chthoniobacterales bacterium]
MRFFGTSGYPPGSLNVNGFSFFNALSFQIILGGPVILFAKSLHASSFVLGTIAALTPLLTVLQLVAARFLHRAGYKRFVLAGWGARTFFTLAVTLLPLVPGLSAGWRLTLLLGALFFFSLLRNFAAGAWLPWISVLVPANMRGRFLSRDHAFMHLGCLAALLVSAWIMAGSVEDGEYAAVFGIGFVAALVSLWFIRRIPEAHSHEEMRRSGIAVPWAAMLRYPPFARLLWFSTMYAAMIGSLGVFTVEFQIVRAKLAESTILLLGSFSFAGALAGLAVTAPSLDATGSKPWLRRAMHLMIAVIAGWLLLAGGILPCRPWLVGALNLLGGVAGAIFGVSSTRILLGSVPVMGRNHFFALFTVVSGLGLGFAPMFWGALLDAVGRLDFTAGPISVNRYTLYFAALVILGWWNQRLVARLHEGATDDTAVPPAEPMPVAPVE